MKTYTLHLPRDARPGDREAFDRAELVKDGFSWGAFFFTVFWFLWNRLWLAALGVFLLVLALGTALELLNVSPVAGTIASLLVQVLIGLEANSLKRWTLARRGRPVADVVSGGDADEAMLKALARLPTAPEHPRPAMPATPLPAGPYRGPEPVIGLFPDAEGRR
jgi:hypothetical protein